MYEKYVHSQAYNIFIFTLCHTGIYYNPIHFD